MLPVDAVRDLVKSCDLEPYVDRVVAAIRAGWALVPDAAADAARISASKIGGGPDLEAGESWPAGPSGAPMVFLAQINSADLPAPAVEWPAPEVVAPGPTLIRVFADLLSAPGAPCAATVLMTQGSVDPLRRRSPADDRDEPLPELAVQAVPFLSVPEVLPGVVDDFSDHWGGSKRAEDYRRFGERLRIASATGDDRRTKSIHQLLGEPVSVQDDVRLTPALLATDHEAARMWGITPDPALGDPAAWRVLLALHDDEENGLSIEDGGALQVMVPAADLAARRFDRLVCAVSSA